MPISRRAALLPSRADSVVAGSPTHSLRPPVRARAGDDARVRGHRGCRASRSAHALRAHRVGDGVDVRGGACARLRAVLGGDFADGRVACGERLVPRVHGHTRRRGVVGAPRWRTLSRCVAARATGSTGLAIDRPSCAHRRRPIERELLAARTPYFMESCRVRILRTFARAAACRPARNVRSSAARRRISRCGCIDAASPRNIACRSERASGR